MLTPLCLEVTALSCKSALPCQGSDDEEALQEEEEEVARLEKEKAARMSASDFGLEEEEEEDDDEDTMGALAKNKVCVGGDLQQAPRWQQPRCASLQHTVPPNPCFLRRSPPRAGRPPRW